MSIVYILQNGKKLDARHFLRYMEKKIKRTGKKFGIKQAKGVYCLDDAAIGIVYGLMAGKKARLKKSAFLFCLRKELEIYGNLRKINFQFIKYKGLKLDISKMLDELEKRHKEIKYSILKAQLQAASLS